MPLKPTEPILRFAPSPNGLLHLGHAFSALVTENLAKKLDGTYLLRIEDIDQNRSKPEFIQNIYHDLAWLGLKWPNPVLLQSTRFSAYENAAKKLFDLGLLYPCFCTRKQIKQLTIVEKDPDGAPLYPGTCKFLRPELIAKKMKAGTPVQYRLHMDKAILLTGPLNFKQLQSDQTMQVTKSDCHPKRWGDVVIQRKDTPTSYHLSVVLDDAFQNVSHITRGNDLLASTDVHRVLQKLLDLPSPVYFHHDLINDGERQKLAKSKGSASLKDFRQSGISAKEIRSKFYFAR